MKQSFALIASMLVCSALIVILAWAPFNYSMSTDKIVKNVLIGAALGLVFYFLALHKKVRRRKPASKPVQHNTAKKKAKAHA
jgi:uncharacterized membrane protein YccC